MTPNTPLKPTDVVDSFTGPWAGLSNFSPTPVTIDAVTYTTPEHAFNALKTLDPAEGAWVAEAPTPGQAKARGRKVTLRPDWDTRVRHEVMAAVTEAKYTDPVARDLLLATGDALLVEGNHWHDQHWGDCTCPQHRSWPGTNHLGRALMRHRAVLRGDPAHRWVRVAVTGQRPQHLSPDQAAFAVRELDRLAVKLEADHGARVAITGLALGTDTWWEAAARAAGLVTWAYSPCAAQADRWSADQKANWEAMRARAGRVLTLGEEYDVRLLHARNDLMLRDADLLIAVRRPSKTTGGTASTVTKARAAGLPIITVDLDAFTTRISRSAG